MPDSDHRLFPCTVLPNTRFRAIVGANVLTLLCAAVLTFVLSPLTVHTFGTGSLALLAVWAGIAYRPGAWNHLADFERRRRVHCGWVAPADAITALGPQRLAVMLVLVTAVPFVGVAGAAYLLARRFRAFRRLSGLGVRQVSHQHGEALFAFLAYPDFSFGAVAGTAAMWIPRESIIGRHWCVITWLLPFYTAVGLPATLLITASAPSLAVLASVSALPIPGIAFAALAMCSLHELELASQSELSTATTDWDQAVGTISRSSYSANGLALSDHLFLGWLLPSHEQAWHPFRKVYDKELPCRTPALIPLSAFDGHAHLCGPTQSGKTTNGQIGIACQLIRGRQTPVVNAKGGHGRNRTGLTEQSAPPPILIEDLKGDLGLFNTIREECECRGQTFRSFTLEQGKATSFFNPLTDLQTAPRPVIELCEMVLNMLDLYHGMQYGASYYGEQTRGLLIKALLSAHAPPQSWEELFELLTHTLDRREHRDAYELLGRVFALVQYPVLGPTPAGIDTIHMPRVIENNECVYFWLPALESSMSVVSIAKMALYCFIDSARKWNNSGRERKHSYLFLDEAQVVCNKGMERVFQQASGARIRMILSNQSLANLDSRDAPNLGHTIWANTRVKQTFGLLDSHERREWIDLSGEEVGCIRSHTVGRSGSEATCSTTWQEVVHTRLNQNAICEVNTTAGQALLYVNGNAGLTPLGSVPREVWCPYPMTYADYLRRSRTPWPSHSEPRIQHDAVEETVVNEQAPEAIERQAESKYAALEELFRDLARQPHHGG